MNSKRKEKPTKKNREEPPGKPVKKGNGAVFGFQILLSCLLIAGAVLLKTGFPPEYEEVRQRYYLLLNEELSFGNFGKYAAKLFRVNDSADAPDPEAFLPAAEGEESGIFSESVLSAEPTQTPEPSPSSQTSGLADTSQQSGESIPEIPVIEEGEEVVMPPDEPGGGGVAG